MTHIRPAGIAFPIELGHVMLFARAVGDPNPIYHDATYAAQTALGHVTAPPTFTEALQHYIPDYPFRPYVGKPWIGSAAAPTGVQAPSESRPVLHAEQHFTYHRPIVVGEVLTATSRAGDEYDKQGRRGGRLIFSEVITEFRDPHGELVVTSRQVGVETQQTVEAGR
jgi:acyl dehydratase